MSKIDLILTELSEKSEKIQNNNDLIFENADFWPVMTPVSVS